MAKVSVIVPAHNAAHTLGPCLASVLDGPWADLEMVVVDDGSTDDTVAVAKALGDPRIRILSLSSRQGPAAARNAGVRQSVGAFLLFLDADCTVSPDWVGSAIAPFDDGAVVAVEGAIHYENDSPTFRHRVPVNPFYNFDAVHPINRGGRDFAAANIAYRRSVFERLGGFDADSFPMGREDTDLGLRASALGKIPFQPPMKVTHRDSNWSARRLWASARRYEADVRLLKRTGSFPFRSGPVLHPRFLLMLVCPPLIAFRYRRQLRSFRDATFVPVFFVYLLLLRLCIWRAAVTNRVLVV